MCPFPFWCQQVQPEGYSSGLRLHRFVSSLFRADGYPLHSFAYQANSFTNILGQFLEGWLWAMQPSKDRGATHADKSTASASTGATAAPATTTGTGAV